MPEPPSSLVFRRKPAPDVRRAPNSVFCPEKPANSSPLNSSPLVTALSPLAFWVQKCVKSGPVPELLLRRVFRGPTARRGPGSESDSPPRWSVSPPSLSPLMSALMSPLHPAPVFGAKSAQNGRVRRVRFSCRTASGMPEPPNSQGLQTSVFRFRPGKAANSSPPSMSPLVTASSPLVTASSPLSLGPKSAQKAWKSETSSAASVRLRSAQSAQKAWKSEVGNPTSLHTEVGLRAWCGPGNPVLGTGMQLQSCCGHRIASAIPAPHTGLPRCTTSSSGLELFLPEHSLLMEPALL